MRFSKKAGRGTALVALAAASTLFAAGCSAGSLGSSSGGEGSAGATTITTFLAGSGDDRCGEREGADRGLPGRQPRHHGQDGHPAGGFGRRQPGQDAAVHRRHGRGLRLQQRLPAAGDQAGAESRRPWTTSRGRASSTRPSPLPARVPTASCTAVRRDGVRRRGALQHPGLQEARPPDPEDLGRVHEEQRRRSRRPAASTRSSRPTARRGPRSCSCSATTTTSQAAGARTSPRSTPPARPSTPPRRPPWPASSTSSRSRTPATSTRTSPRPS